MKFVLILVGMLFCTTLVMGQQSTIGQEFNPITTSVPFLLISPDARHAALGDAGVASSPDASAAFWNPGKLTFIENPYGATFSYTPWLGKITNDMSIVYLNGFYKITREQTVALSMKYFDMGVFDARGQAGEHEGTFHPRDFSFDLTYSRLLTENFSVGITGRFIHSNLLGSYEGSSNTFSGDQSPGNSVAADLGIFYTTELKGTKINTLSLGAVISNIGPRLSNSTSTNPSKLPTNLKLGGAYMVQLDPFNSFTFLLDFNKLLVPTPGEDGSIPDKSLLSGMFSSFGDAPGGISEEIKEITISAGVEYWYKNVFAGRVGYFSEAQLKGNRKYLTLGVGFNIQKFAIDVAYLVPTNLREHPLAETIRFGLKFNIPAKMNEETVTD